MGIHLHRDIPGLGQGYLAVEDGVRHGVAGLHRQVHGVEVRVQPVKIAPDAFQVPAACQDLHSLDVVSVVVPPAPHLAVHVLYLLIVGLDELALVGGDAPVNEFCEKLHGLPPYVRAMMARFSGS